MGITFRSPAFPNGKSSKGNGCLAGYIPPPQNQAGNPHVPCHAASFRPAPSRHLPPANREFLVLNFSYKGGFFILYDLTLFPELMFPHLSASSRRPSRCTCFSWLHHGWTYKKAVDENSPNDNIYTLKICLMVYGSDNTHDHITKSKRPHAIYDIAWGLLFSLIAPTSASFNPRT